jgi:hypothetical protein
MTSTSGGQRGRARMSPESVAVIVNGWPDPQALNVAKSLVKRGFQVVPFGLTTSGNKEFKVTDIPEITEPIRLVKFSDTQQAKNSLQERLNELRNQDKFVVVVDTTAEGVDEHVKLYNDLKVPFVLESRGGESHQRAVRETEQARSLALITEQMNKRMSVMDQMWREWSRRYPGVFDDFDFNFRSSRPDETPKSLMDSFSDLVNRELGVEDIQPIDSGFKSSFEGPSTESHMTREYSFRNGSGSSTYSFRQSVNNEQEFAESVADSVGFLAQKSQDLSRPHVYNILDVATQPRLLGW